jgi:hypothetical protein
VYRLQIQLLLGLDGHEAHRRPLYSFGDGLRINVIAFVRLYERFDILSGHQSGVVTLFSQGSSQKMRTATGFHTDSLDAQVRCVLQQLRARTPLAHDYVAGGIEAHQVK